MNLIDPTGLGKCCPTKEQDDVQKGADNARRRLDHLFQFGTALLPTDGPSNVGGLTGCTSGSFAILDGRKVPLSDQYQMTINVDPKKRPCEYECALKHEMVHARMCGSVGGTKFNALLNRGAERDTGVHS